MSPTLTEVYEEIKRKASFDDTKQIILRLDEDPNIFDFRLREFSIYGICRFQVELKFYGLSVGDAANVSRVKRVYVYARNRIAALYRKIKTDLISKVSNPARRIQKANILVISNSYALTKRGFHNFAYFNYYDFLFLLSREKIPFNYFHAFLNKEFVSPPFIGNLLPFSSTAEKLSSREKEEVKIFLQYLTKRLNINFEADFDAYVRFLEETLGRYVSLCKYIKKTECKLVCGISVYNSPWVMMACDKYNIQSLELQHGPLLPSLTYFQTSKKGNSRKYDLLFPSYHAVLGKAWKNILLSHDFRWTECNTVTIGSSFFETYLTQRKISLQKQFDNKKVLVVSQPFFFSMLPFLTEILNAHHAELLVLGYKIVVRPHPSEDIKGWERLKEQHGEIVQLEDSRSIHIYETFRDVSIVVGAASTAIYESLSFGIPVIIPAVFEKYNLKNTFLTYENTQQFMDSLKNPETYIEKANPGFLSFLQTEEFVDFLKRNNFYEQG